MSSAKIAPVIPVPKRPNAFSIDSIMGKEPEKRPPSSGDDSDVDSTDDSPRRPSPSDHFGPHSLGTRIPPLHPSLPAHVQQLLLRDASGRGAADLLSLRSHALAFGNPPISGVHGMGIPTHTALPAFAAQFGAHPGHLSHGMSTHPGFMAASVPGREHMPMYPPWMLNKPGLMGYPFGKQI